VTQTGIALTFEVYGADGASLFESPRIDVAAGAMVYADVARDDLNDPGDPNTRPLQIRVVFRTVLPPGSPSSDLTPLAEVYSSATGVTELPGNERPEYLVMDVWSGRSLAISIFFGGPA